MLCRVDEADTEEFAVINDENDDDKVGGEGDGERRGVVELGDGDGTGGGGGAGEEGMTGGAGGDSTAGGGSTGGDDRAAGGGTTGGDDGASGMEGAAAGGLGEPPEHVEQSNPTLWIPRLHLWTEDSGGREH